MVDFNSESTITRPATDIERISVLQRRAYFIDVYEKYLIDISRGVRTSTQNMLRGALYSLFMQLQGYLKRMWDKKMDGKQTKYELYKKELQSKDTESDRLLEIFEDISILLDTMKLTKLDNIKTYDKSRITQSNEVQDG